MNIKYKISENDVTKAREKMKTIKNKNIYKKLELIALLGEGKSIKKINEITKYNKTYIGELRKQFSKQGIEIYSKDKRRGGNHVVMPTEKINEFLREFEIAAKKGEVLTINEMAKKLDEQTDKVRKSKSTIHYFLHRNGYRKIKPRSEHPQKAKTEDIESSKKLKNC